MSPINPSTFDWRLIGGVITGFGGLVAFIWKVKTDLSDEALQARKQLLDEMKLETDEIKAKLDRAAAERKPAIESLATVAIEAANKYYRPVIDSVCGVGLYAKTYQDIEKIISAAREKIETGQVSGDIAPIARQALEGNPDARELLKAMEEARPNCADYVFSELERLHRNVEALISSGYVWDLGKDVGRDAINNFYNWHYAAGVPALLKNRSPEELSRFLASWKPQELDPLRALTDKVPWETFFSNYYWKLHDCVAEKRGPYGSRTQSLGD